MKPVSGYPGSSYAGPRLLPRPSRGPPSYQSSGPLPLPGLRLCQASTWRRPGAEVAPRQAYWETLSAFSRWPCSVRASTHLSKFWVLSAPRRKPLLLPVCWRLQIPYADLHWNSLLAAADSPRLLNMYFGDVWVCVCGCTWVCCQRQGFFT